MLNLYISAHNRISLIWHSLRSSAQFKDVLRSDPDVVSVNLPDGLPLAAQLSIEFRELCSQGY